MEIFESVAVRLGCVLLYIVIGLVIFHFIRKSEERKHFEKHGIYMGIYDLYVLFIAMGVGWIIALPCLWIADLKKPKREKVDVKDSE
jgi:hypothetical protein